MIRPFHRFLALTAVLGLLVLTASLPVLAQTGEATGITHRQSVRVEKDASGSVQSARVFTQLTVQGSGQVEVALPNQSTRGLRNLDGFGGPRTDGGQVIHTIEASADGSHARTVATHRDDLPIELSVVYRLDGQEIAPRDLVGRSGELEVSFTARNTTVEPVEVEYRDGRNVRQRETIDVAVPFVGSISMDLDRRFVDIDAPGASVAGNGRGDTFVSWSMVLFSPVGSEEQTVTYTAQVTDAVVPAVVAQFLPVDSNSFGSLASVQQTFGDLSDGLRDLTGGALLIDSNLNALAAGSAQLLIGIGRLSRGASDLATGLNETAIPGAAQLAEGTGAARDGSRQLAAGLGDLSAGAGELSSGLRQASAGASTLAGGLAQLDAGAATVNTGIAGVRTGVGNANDTAADETVIGGVNSLRDGVASIPQSVESALEANLREALNGIVLPQLQANLQAGLQTNLAGGLRTQVKPSLVVNLESELETNLGAVLTLVLLPDLLIDLEEQVEAGLTASLTPALQAELANNLAAALAAPAPLGLDIDAAIAGIFADGFAEEFAPVFASLFAQEFAVGFVEQVEPELEAAFGEVANQFAMGFADGFEEPLGEGFDSFAAAFAPLFATGFATQVGPSFAAFSEQFAEQFAAGLDATLNEEALPGFSRLLNGLNNPTCDSDDPTNPANPCGIRQVLALLDAGSSDLASGTSQARGGATDLSSGLSQLNAGGQQLAAGASSAASGSRDLASGLEQIDDGANQLSSGLGDAGDGASQISEGLETVEGGMAGVADGSKRLVDEGTQVLISAASDATSTPALAVEQAMLADARGQAGEGLPYGTADGAVASAVYQYELAAVTGSQDGPSLPLQGGLAILALGLAGGLTMLVRGRLA